MPEVGTQSETDEEDWCAKPAMASIRLLFTATLFLMKTADKVIPEIHQRPARIV